MNRYERIISVPSVTITKRLSALIADELHALAETRVDQEVTQFLRTFYNSEQQVIQGTHPNIKNAEDFIAANIQDPASRNVARARVAENYTFLANRGNVKIVGDDFEFEHIPLDTNGVLARADGANGEFISITIKARFNDYNDLRNGANNQIVIQGPFQNWVDGVYQRILSAIESEKNPVRHVIYKLSLLWTWITFALLVCLEYLLVRVFVPTYTLQVPLTGLSILLVGLILLFNVLLVGNLFIRIAGYFYPYFEFTDNLSRPRTLWRKVFTGTVIAAYSGTIGLLIRMIAKR